MTPYWNAILDISAGSSADVLMLGANYDANLTYPPLFDAHFTPWLKKFSEMLHAKDKFLLIHTDGENTGLLDAYLRSGIDVADSVCPAPMTRLGIREVRDAFG